MVDSGTTFTYFPAKVGRTCALCWGGFCGQILQLLSNAEVYDTLRQAIKEACEGAQGYFVLWLPHWLQPMQAVLKPGMDEPSPPS